MDPLAAPVQCCYCPADAGVLTDCCAELPLVTSNIVSVYLILWPSEKPPLIGQNYPELSIRANRRHSLRLPLGKDKITNTVHD